MNSNADWSEKLVAEVNPYLFECDGKTGLAIANQAGEELSGRSVIDREFQDVSKLIEGSRGRTK